MSRCSHTLRALSGSRILPSKTLLPFLYQTPTIQQWQPATRPTARRTITSRSRPNNRSGRSFKEAVPFEDDNLPPAIDQEPQRPTTITGSERQAFQKLYKKFKTEGQQRKGKDDVVELDQIADEYYENDEKPAEPSLDKVFDEVLTGKPIPRAPRTVAQRQNTKGKDFGQDALLSLQKAAKSEEPGKAPSGSKKGEKMDVIKVKEMRLAERERVDKLIRSAPTDRALWQVLEREVFEKVRELDLDRGDPNDSTGTKHQASKSSGKPKKTTKSVQKFKPDPPSTNARILFQNYPHHLIIALHMLRTEFPSSTLPSAILPTIKSLGRSSHALGATTTLYRHLIRTAWIQQASYTSIDTLLTEMDHNAIEFDADILALLDAIIKEHTMARTGHLSKEMQLVYGMEMWLEGMKKIKEWRDVVAQRLGIASQEKRDSGLVVRRVTQEKTEKLWRSIDPAQRSGEQGHNRDREHVPLVEGVNQEAQDAVPPQREHGQRAATMATEPIDDEVEGVHRPAKILL
jgi:hypothetical protein